MGTANKTPYFFKSKPLFGLDIGVGTLKVVQLDADGIAPKEPPKATKKGAKPHSGPKPKLVGFGLTSFDESAVENGVIIKPEIVAAAVQELFKTKLTGDVTTRRVVMAIPAYCTFIRSIKLPPLKPSERAEAVKLEVEQYLPNPIDEMYTDYTPILQNADGTEMLVVAVSKDIVDSYLELAAMMGVEPVLIETTMNAAGRVFRHDSQSDVATAIIDFGTRSSDISIYDGGIVTAGTVEGGGQVFTNVIQKALGVSGAEAQVIKSKYGLGVSKRQAEIQKALEPTLQKIVKEIRRLIRYHNERYGNDHPIQQVITLGGGAYMPGLSDYFTDQLRVAVRAFDPWQHVEANAIKAPEMHDRFRYTTAIGLALTPAEDVFK